MIRVLKWLSNLIYPHHIIILDERYAAWEYFSSVIEQRIENEYPEKFEEMKKNLLEKARLP